MQPNVVRSARLDGVDKERFRAMLASESFGLLRVRIEAELVRARETCQRSDSGLEVRRCQGAVAALEAVMKLPERILGEMSKGLEKE